MELQMAVVSATIARLQTYRNINKYHFFYSCKLMLYKAIYYIYTFINLFLWIYINVYHIYIYLFK